MRIFRFISKRFAFACLIAATTMISFWLSHRSRAQGIPPSTTVPVESEPLPATVEDPAEAVELFVDQNQKLAETELGKLRDEEAKLRARLAKVETGIKRWQAVVDALKASKDGPPAPRAVVSEANSLSAPEPPALGIVNGKAEPSPADTPTALDPIPNVSSEQPVTLPK